jgi:hypothetical protein
MMNVHLITRTLGTDQNAPFWRLNLIFEMDWLPAALWMAAAR